MTLRPCVSWAALVRDGAARLEAAGVESPALDARLLAAHAFSCDRLTLLAQGERRATPEEEARLRGLIERRAVERISVARLLGEREFYGLPIGLNEATLEPRPDSETLIEALRIHPFLEDRRCDPALRFLDLGTGSGCLLLALLSLFPAAHGTGTDKAPRALEQARANAARLGLQERSTFQETDWLEGIDSGASFDVVLSNPPYIRSADIPDLMPEVRDHDPRLALDGGADGLEPYRIIARDAPRVLKPNGLIALEIGATQAEDVQALLAAQGFQALTLHRDLAGLPRGVVGSFLTP